MINVGRRMRTEPVPVERQVRSIPFRGAGTIAPGQFYPVGAFNLLREDSVHGRVPFAMELAPTHELLMNRVMLRVSAWYVPHVALDRFQGNPTFFHKSYMGEEPMDGETVIPFIQTAPFGTFGANKVYQALGLFAPAAQNVNTSYLESYNHIWNYVAVNRSKDITPRALTDVTIAPAFWGENNLSEIVPDFDDGLIAGEVPLTVVAQNMPVVGIGLHNTKATVANGSVRETDKVAPTAYPNYQVAQTGGVNNIVMRTKTSAAEGLVSYPAVYAEMQENNIVVSLANIAQAQKLVSWANMRAMYEGHSEEWVVDSYMQGFHIEEQKFLKPMLLSQMTTQFVQAQRWATDGENLTEKATSGIARGSIQISVPQNTYGGVVMVIAEVVPEQLYERQVDPWFVATSVDDLPNYQKDVLNPMPVVQVLNKEVDPEHNVPNGLFGYARRNWKWLKWPMRVGGIMHYKSSDTATAAERKRIWPTERLNPSLSADFYLANGLSKAPFIDQTGDPVTFGFSATMSIVGLTLVGAVHESEANYQKMRDVTPPLVPIKD